MFYKSLNYPNLKTTGIESESQLQILKFQPILNLESRIRIVIFAKFARFGRNSNPNLKSTGIESESQLQILKFQPSPESRISNSNLDICTYRIRISKPNLKRLPNPNLKIRVRDSYNNRRELYIAEEESYNTRLQF